MAKQTKLTKAARGEECTLQIHPYCNDNPETVVYCHLPSPDKGMALKSPDSAANWDDKVVTRALIPEIDDRFWQYINIRINTR
jgi:hypothetical protein